MEAEINKINALLAEANSARKESRFEDAKRSLVSALSIARLIHNMKLRAQTLNDLARIERDLGNTISSIAGYMKVVKLCDQIGDTPGMARAFRHLGDLHREVNNFHKAEGYYKKAIAIYRHVDDGNPLNLATTFRGYALLLIKQDKKKESLALWDDARKIYKSQNIRERVKECDLWIKKLG